MATTTGEQAAGRGENAGRESAAGARGGGRGTAGSGHAYQWVALSNTTLAMVMATIDGSNTMVS